MPFNRDRKSGKDPSPGWVRSRKKFGEGPPVRYSFSRDGKSSEEEDSIADSLTGEFDVADSRDGEVDSQDSPVPDISGSAATDEPSASDEQRDGSSFQDPQQDEPSASDEQRNGLSFPDTQQDEPSASDEQPDGSMVPAVQPEEPSDTETKQEITSGTNVDPDEGEEEKESRAALLRKKFTKKRVDMIRMVIRTAVTGFFAFLFLMPIVLTISNSFMTVSEINANYGVIFAKKDGVRVFISQTVNLKFIPDIISFGQYFKVLFLSPEYLLKFWNSFFYVVPIVVFQLVVAALASYGFARYRGKVREVIFFSYIILMLMPYQVTLVPNFLVSTWLNIINTRWAILLPGFFSPFAVYMLTKYMRRIPKSIYEAAEIDGAGEWQIFTGICLPNCRGGLVSIAILIFIDYWNMVEQPLILLSDDQMHPLSVFLSRINANEISLAFAVAVIYMILPMMVFLYGEDYLVEGIIYQGGIKE